MLIINMGLQQAIFQAIISSKISAEVRDQAASFQTAYGFTHLANPSRFTLWDNSTLYAATQATPNDHDQHKAPFDRGLLGRRIFLTYSNALSTAIDRFVPDIAEDVITRVTEISGVLAARLFQTPALHGYIDCGDVYAYEAITGYDTDGTKLDGDARVARVKSYPTAQIDALVLTYLNRAGAQNVSKRTLFQAAADSAAGYTTLDSFFVFQVGAKYFALDTNMRMIIGDTYLGFKTIDELREFVSQGKDTTLAVAAN